MTPVVEGVVEPESPGPAAPRERVGQSLAWLTIANLAQKASSVVLAVLLRAILGPTKTGVWNLVEVWRQQLSTLTLGPSWAAAREMPMLRAQGRHDDVDEIRNVTFTYLAGEAAALGIAFWAYLAIDHGGWSTPELLGLALVPLLATFTTLYSAYEQFLKTEKEFRFWGKFSLTQLLIDWSIIVFVLLGGLTGLLLGLLIGWTLRLGSVWWMVRARGVFQLRLKLRLSRLKELLSFGAPLAFWNIGWSMIARLDSIAIASLLGPTALGLYYLGPQIALTLSALPAALSVVSYPALMERYGREGAAALAPHMKDYMRSMSLIAAPATVAIGFFGLPVLVNSFLPAFDDGLPAMKIAMLVLVFSQPAMLFVQLMLAEKLVLRVIVVTFAALAVECAVLGAGIAAGLTIEWAAWGAVAGQAGFSLIALGATIRQLRLSREAILSFWGRLPVAWIGFLGLALGVDALIPDPQSFATGVLSGTAQIAAFCGLSALLVVALDRHAFSASRALLRVHV